MRACSATEDRTRCYVSNAVVKRRGSVALYGKVPQPREIRRWAREETAPSAAFHEIVIVHVPDCCCCACHMYFLGVCPYAPDECPDTSPHVRSDGCPHASSCMTAQLLLRNASVCHGHVLPVHLNELASRCTKRKECVQQQESHCESLRRFQHSARCTAMLSRPI